MEFGSGFWARYGRLADSLALASLALNLGWRRMTKIEYTFDLPYNHWNSHMHHLKKTCISRITTFSENTNYRPDFEGQNLHYTCVLITHGMAQLVTGHVCAGPEPEGT